MPRSWIAIGRSAEVAQPGQFVLADVADESLVIVRGDDGALRALFNVCRHRGTRLCTQPIGTLHGTLQCPYHAWTYGLDGRLLVARNMDDVAGFDRAEYSLKTAALADWEGFVFVNVAAEAGSVRDSVQRRSQRASHVGA